LAEELREMVSVSVILDGIRYRIAHATVNQSITVDISVEARGAPYDTASGRLLMAYLDRENLRLVLKKNGFPGRRWNGIERSGALNKKLSEIRSRGLAFWRADDGQVEAVAAPVFGPDKKVWAALGVGVPSFRFRGAERVKIISALKTASEQMSFDLTLRYGEVDLHVKKKKDEII
jgi:DNA-binding IclR family transcriptional regulator